MSKPGLAAQARPVPTPLSMAPAPLSLFSWIFPLVHSETLVQEEPKETKARKLPFLGGCCLLSLCSLVLHTVPEIIPKVKACPSCSAPCWWLWHGGSGHSCQAQGSGAIVGTLLWGPMSALLKPPGHLPGLIVGLQPFPLPMFARAGGILAVVQAGAQPLNPL